MPETTTRERLGALVRKHPDWDLGQMAAELGVSRERVRQLLDLLDYEWRAEWRKRRGVRR